MSAQEITEETVCQHCYVPIYKHGIESDWIHKGDSHTCTEIHNAEPDNDYEGPSGIKRCPDCGDRLCKNQIVDVPTGEDKGHIWACPECKTRFVGFDEPGEYVGEPVPGYASDEH